jgi:hypothetical protein
VITSIKVYSLICICFFVNNLCAEETVLEFKNNTNLLGVTTNSKTQLGIYYATRVDKSEGLGWSFDFGISIPSSPPDRQVMSFSKYTAEQVFQDRKTEIRTTFMVLNIGRNIKFNEYITGSLSLGYGSKTTYQGYYDKFGILGDGGNYYLKESSDGGLNVEMSAHISPVPQKNSFHFTFGYNTYLNTASLGLGW